MKKNDLFRSLGFLVSLGMFVSIWLPACACAAEQELVRVAEDGRGFVLAELKQAFVPWGFNYDHDEEGRLIEDYWEAEWDKVEQDFREMKELGANVVRIHLQVGKFMDDARKPNARSLEQLGRLVALAEKERLYLDVTGLGCYHKKDVPAWYDQLDEAARWDVEAQFWEAIAERCSKSNAIFCYDLMNEPVSPGGDQPAADWLGPAFAGKHFVQRIALDRKGRERHVIAQQWIHELTTAIHKHDRRHMITVGLVDWSLDRPGLTSGFVPEKVAGDLDFIAVHLYPKARKGGEAIETLKGFSVGKPVVIEETFPLVCSADELGEFIDRSKPHAAGWIGFYWGKTPAECRQSGTIQDALVLSWLELFERKRAVVRPSP
jgi:cellulase (glycosyl hydrolase family 5)